MAQAFGSPTSGPLSSGNLSRTGSGGSRSIGEVLAVLKSEFDDISISKIRFLESEGLVTPQRTASGYRKFSSTDIERLKFILRQQKENFLPLKVIRERLDDNLGVVEPQAEVAPEPVSPTAVVVEEPLPANVTELPQRTPAPGIPSGPLSRRDLIKASGITEHTMRDLESFNLVKGERTATGVWFESQALGIARLAGRFLEFGVEPRHLRIFRTSADREADLYKQLVVPQKASRSQQTDIDNRARMEELTSLGAALHDELLRQALDKH